MIKALEKKKKYLLVWGVVCLLAVLAGVLRPVEQKCSQGLEGANQANLHSFTDELTEGHVLQFRVAPPAETAEEIGFYFRTDGQDFQEGNLRLTAMDQEEVIGGREYPLKELTEDQFLFVKLSHAPEELTVYVTCDAPEGPSLWLNEGVRTPGEASLDGKALEKSLIYNLTYTVQIHQYQKPILFGVLLFLLGAGVYSAGGFVRPEKKRKTEKTRRSCHPSGKQLLGLAGAVFLTALAFFYLYDTKIRIAQNTTEKAVVLEADGNLLAVTEERAQISQLVEPGEDRLTGLGVRFFLEGTERLTEGSMHASVTDLTLNQVLCEADIAAEQFISGEFIGLLFENSQEGAADHRYRIDLEFSPELWDSGLMLMTSEEGICVNAYLYFNIFLFFMFLGTEVFVCLFWYLVFVKRARIEQVFLTTILFLGLIYNVMLTPGMVPDEKKHIDMTYRYSNELLGYESLGDTKCLMRAEDADLEFTSSPSLSNYRNVYYGLFSRAEDERMVEAEASSNLEGSRLLYAPAVAGMSLARLLGLGPVPMLLLARYLNLAAFALLTWAGMKRLPFGKVTLFLLAILPVNMQQCTSFSHDAVVHGILFFYSCLCLEAIFSEKRVTGQQMALMGLAGWSLVYCKGGSYLPLAFLPILIPSACFAGKKEKWQGTGALLGIPVLAGNSGSGLSDEADADGDGDRHCNCGHQCSQQRRGNGVYDRIHSGLFSEGAAGAYLYDGEYSA